MTRRQHQRSQEIMLIPFLDILCSLIGVLVLIIVVLVVAQTQRISGRTPEELQRATEHQAMLKQQKENLRVNELLREKTPELEKLRTQAREQEQRIAKIRMLLSASEADLRRNQEVSQNLLKELDNLLLEKNGLTTQEAPLKQQVEELQAEIAKRQVSAQKGPPLIVQPGGSGFAKGSQIFFVEATAGKLTFYWNEKERGTVSAVPEAVAADVAFNLFLKNVLAVPKSKLVFLLRDDGMGAYNLGAGWAQATYGYRVDQVGKLPLPGRGEVDLKMFQEYLGSLNPPPQAQPPK